MLLGALPAGTVFDPGEVHDPGGLKGAMRRPSALMALNKSKNAFCVLLLFRA
jgi:hypothetical protein